MNVDLYWIDLDVSLHEFYDVIKTCKQEDMTFCISYHHRKIKGSAKSLKKHKLLRTSVYLLPDHSRRNKSYDILQVYKTDVQFSNV